jgi:hypothetical protein
VAESRTLKKRTDRLAADRIDPVWRKLGERFEDEEALAESRVRDDESRLFELRVAE